MKEIKRRAVRYPKLSLYLWSAYVSDSVALASLGLALLAGAGQRCVKNNTQLFLTCYLRYASKDCLFYFVPKHYNIKLG